MKQATNIVRASFLERDRGNTPKSLDTHTNTVGKQTEPRDLPRRTDELGEMLNSSPGRPRPASVPARLFFSFFSLFLQPSFSVRRRCLQFASVLPVSYSRCLDPVPGYKPRPILVSTGIMTYAGKTRGLLWFVNRGCDLGHRFLFLLFVSRPLPLTRGRSTGWSFRPCLREQGEPFFASVQCSDYVFLGEL